jgi:hypothetical protein
LAIFKGLVYKQKARRAGVEKLKLYYVPVWHTSKENPDQAPFGLVKRDLGCFDELSTKLSEMYFTELQNASWKWGEHEDGLLFQDSLWDTPDYRKMITRYEETKSPNLRFILQLWNYGCAPCKTEDEKTWKTWKAKSTRYGPNSPLTRKWLEKRDEEVAKNLARTLEWHPWGMRILVMGGAHDVPSKLDSKMEITVPEISRHYWGEYERICREYLGDVKISNDFGLERRFSQYFEKA